MRASSQRHKSRSIDKGVTYPKPSLHPTLPKKDTRMKIAKLSALCLSAFVAIGTAQAADPVSEKDKTLYALGVAVSQSLVDFGLTEAELDQIRSHGVRG